MTSDLMFIDPRVHMISRTTDDYQAMAAAGVVAVIEPAFWVGQPRTSVAGSGLLGGLRSTPGPEWAASARSRSCAGTARSGSS